MTKRALQGRHDVVAAQPNGGQGLAVLLLQQRLHLLLRPCMAAVQAARCSAVSPCTTSDAAGTKVLYRNATDCRRNIDGEKRVREYMNDACPFTRVSVTRKRRRYQRGGGAGTGTASKGTGRQTVKGAALR